jgi:hypothetical protein
MRFQQTKELLALTGAQKEVILVVGRQTHYGWLIKLPDGTLVEVATEDEAYELLKEAEE